MSRVIFYTFAVLSVGLVFTTVGFYCLFSKRIFIGIIALLLGLFLGLSNTIGFLVGWDWWSLWQMWIDSPTS